MRVNDAPFDIRKELAQLFGTTPASLDDGILEHLETSYNDPGSLKEFLTPFLVASSESHQRDLDDFIHAFFHQRKRRECFSSPQKTAAPRNPSTPSSQGARGQNPHPNRKGSPCKTAYLPYSKGRKPQPPWTSSKLTSEKQLDGDPCDSRTLSPQNGETSSGALKAMPHQDNPGSQSPSMPLFAHRMFCRCNAEYGPHVLLGNCIRCGKIACTAMGVGPCLHCGNDIVLSPSAPPHLLAMAMAKNETNFKGAVGRASDLDPERDEALRKALEQKDRLLEYQKTSAQRTKVYDDATDWFSEAGNIWRSESDRLQLAANAMAETSRQNRDRWRRALLHLTSVPVARLTVGGSADKSKCLSKRQRTFYDQRFVNIDLQTGRFVDASKAAQPTNEAVQAFLSNDQECDPFRQERADSTVNYGPASTVTLRMTAASKSLYDRLQQEATKRETNYARFHDEPQDLATIAPAVSFYLQSVARSKESGCRAAPSRSEFHRIGVLLLPQVIEKLPEHIREELENGASTVEEWVAFPSMENARTAGVGPSAYEGASLEIFQQDPNFLSANKKDEGVCLTLHQPWATLLVYGFKKAEFRSWPTSHRGRLWIHAASRVPTVAEIEAQELLYAAQRSAEASDGPLPCLPTSYPTSALLGCVDVVDCVPGDTVGEAEVNVTILASDDAHESPPANSKSSSTTGVADGKAFAFLCENPMRLLLPILMSGGHKLWKLPRDRLAYFQRALRPIK